MVKGALATDKLERFAKPPWTKESEQWLELDDRLSANHLARLVDYFVDRLDLTPLWDSYLGVGKKSLPPDLLLKAALYEMQSKRPSPAQWTKDVRDDGPVRWLLLGLEPSRTCLYSFRERLAPYLEEWNAQILRLATESEMTPASRVALDSTTVAANASRRQFLNEDRLKKRLKLIEESLPCVERGEAIPEKPGWLAATAPGLREQKQRYELAAEILQQRQEANQHRKASKRKPAEKVLVSAADPEAALARDKENVFRPLYSVQLLRDLDSALIFSYSVLSQINDNSVLEPMVERMVDNVGGKPKEVLVDAGYVSMRHLEFCSLADITLYGPCQENDFSVQNDKKPQSNQHTLIPKSAFTWLEREQTYQCPEGHRLNFAKETQQARVDHSVRLSLYVCPPEHCQACPRQASCTTTPAKGRTVSRLENEELLEALRQRMQTPEAKELYKQRSRTVELNFADMKEHRGLRRFHCRRLKRVRTEVGIVVLAHNMVHVAAQTLRTPDERLATDQPTQTAHVV